MMEMAQVGVRTRARSALALAAAAATTAAATSATTKKRKVNNHELKFSIKLRSTRRGRVFITPDNNSSLPSPPPPEINSDHVSVIDDRCSSPSSDQPSASCCSSNYYDNGSRKGIIKFADLEERSVEVETSMYYTCGERREATPSSEVREESSEELDSTARRSSEANSGRGEKMTPTEAELEDFFTEAEKNLQKQFAEKYNYDILKDEPLEGRYEWVRLMP